MTITFTLYVPERNAWREWLAANHRTEREIWLIFYKVRSGKPSIAYNDAVEEALCFGWIDSIVKPMDADRFAQRFTPRRRGSPFSQPNKERLRRMAEQNKIHPQILESVQPVLDEPFVIAPDIREALTSNERALDHFRNFSEAYQRIRIAYVESARDQPEEFAKRLDHFIKKTGQGKQFGHGIETYF